MTEAAKKFLDAFDSLPPSDRREVLLTLLRRAAFGDHDLPDEADLVSAADHVFVELDRHESQE